MWIDWFHNIEHIIKRPLSTEISSYVIQLRSKAVFKLGWPSGLWKLEIIPKVQWKISDGSCLSPFTFPLFLCSLTTKPGLLALKLCENCNLWFQLTEWEPAIPDLGSKNISNNRKRLTLTLCRKFEVLSWKMVWNPQTAEGIKLHCGEDITRS